MEKRIGVVAIILTSKHSVPSLNEILSRHGEIIIGRLGLPLRDKGLHVISLIVEGSTDDIGSLCGQIGRLEDVLVKSVLTPYKEENHDTTQPRA